MNTRETRLVKVGSVLMGGNSPVSVQSMTTTKTADVSATLAQIKSLEEAGCEVIRVAVPDMMAAKAVGAIKQGISIPLVADIHIDHKLALEVIRQGVDKVRINPGNIGGEEKVREVVLACQDRKIPIRIGVNEGSIEKDLLQKYGPTPLAAVESCLRHVIILERHNFEDILLSIKFSDVGRMVEAYRILADRVSYPLHLGVTHAGTPFMGGIKNAIGIGILLNEKIGATLRVSLTGPPEQEIRVGIAILKALGLRKGGLDLVSCPTCGRTEIDLVGLAEKVEQALAKINKPIKVAVMGCVVNGPGEAREADIGVAGGKGRGVIFVRGEIVRTVSEEEILPALLAEIEKF